VDSVGELYGPFQDSIVYDPDPPSKPIVEIVVGGGLSQPIPMAEAVMVRVTASDPNSGVDRVQISDDLDFGTFAEFPFIGPTTEVPWALQETGEVYVRVLDRAGNVSVISGAQAQLDFYIYLPIVLRNAP
jgi:hypothetical protein